MVLFSWNISRERVSITRWREAWPPTSSPMLTIMRVSDALVIKNVLSECAHYADRCRVDPWPPVVACLFKVIFTCVLYGNNCCWELFPYMCNFLSCESIECNILIKFIHIFLWLTFVRKELTRYHGTIFVLLPQGPVLFCWKPKIPMGCAGGSNCITPQNPHPRYRV